MTAEPVRRAPSPTELVLVDALLTMLSRRMAGALDLGLTLLLDAQPDRYTSFVSDHVAAPMRAAGLVLRLALAEVTPAPARVVLESISADTEGFVAALVALGEFQNLPAEDLQDAVAGLRRHHRRLNDSILDIAARLNFHASATEHADRGGDAFHENILEQLHADLILARASKNGEPSLKPILPIAPADE